MVCRPMELGGLGISSLKELGWALQMRWLWLQKTEPNRPWSALPIHIPGAIDGVMGKGLLILRRG
jgi:hypothetical protein